VAGKELKATEKTVLKHSRDGVLEQNLADGSAKKVSNKVEEAVLKTARPDDERFDKLKAAGLITSEHKKRVYTNLKFGRNNPDKSDNDGDNQQSEQTVSAFIPPLGIKFKAKSVDKKQFGATALRQERKQRINDENTKVKVQNEAFEAENTDIPQSNDISEQKFKKPSKLNDGKVRNTLQEYSSAAEKLTDDRTESGILNFDKDDVSVGDKLISDNKADKKLLKQVSKDEKKLAKADKKLQKAQDRLPTQQNIRIKKEFDPKKGKVQRKLCFEKEIKPIKSDGLITKGVKGAKNAVSASVSGTIHNQFAKYEDENQTLKAAHGTEKVAESALRFASHKVKATNQKLKEKPYKKVSKLKFDTENAHKKLGQHKVALDHKTEQQTKKEAKKDTKKALKKAQQKQNQKNAAKTAKKGATTAGKKAGEAAMDVSKTVVKFVANNKVVIIILIIFLLLFGLILSLGSSLFTSLADTGTMVIASSYTSEDEDIYAANDYMNSLENNLNDQINNIPNVYVGWNEYNYYIDPIQHDPYELISYLTAMKIDFEYDAEIQGLIQEIFNALYTLEVESIHEVRSYQYIEYDEEGNEILVTVYYDYYILNVTLTANDWDSVVKPKLEAAGVYDVYLLLLETKGNKPDLF